MIRLLLILLAIVGTVVGVVWGFNRLISPEARMEKLHEMRGQQHPVPQVQTPLPALPDVSVVEGKPVESSGSAKDKPLVGAVEATGFYVFLNRTVPKSPFNSGVSTLGSAKDERNFQLGVDEVSNAWVMRGPPLEVDQYERMAKALDLPQDELDLDFVLVSVSEDWLRGFGVSVHFQDGASWSSLFGLDAEGSTLRFASRSVAIDATLGESSAAVRLVSSPVVRSMTGEKFSFSADTQVPVAVTDRSDGVVSTSYEYRSVGLGLDGLVRRMRDREYKLELEQRNGTVESQAGAPGMPPELREQVLKTSVMLGLAEWSCVGGVRSWRTEKRKRLLGSEEKEEQDLLLIFCRPRVSLGNVPRAWPVGEGPVQLEDLGVNTWDIGSGHPLLPDPPQDAGGAKRSLESLEGEFLNERRASKRKTSLGPPNRR